MTTFQIISSQLKFLNSNKEEYLLICIPILIMSIAAEYVYIHPIISLLIGILYLALYFLLAVNVHRLVILGENTNYYSLKERFKPTFLYFGYLLLISIVSWGAWGVFALIIILTPEIFTVTILSTIILSLLFLLAIFCSFVVYPSLALNLPLVSIGEKVHFFKMWKLSKGFKLTIFLQFIIIWIVYAIVSVPFIYIGIDLVTNIIISIFAILSTSLTVSCLSKTYLLWKEKNNE